MTREIPTQADHFTVSWLNDVLGARALLGKATITEAKGEVLGVGEGFMGDVIRLRLTLDRPDDGEGVPLPETVIAKLPTEVPANRALGELMGAYEREIHFYESLGHELPIRVPRVYYSDMEPNPMSGLEVPIASLMDRLPMSVHARMMAFAKSTVLKRARKYVLLIEELSSGRVGDQIAGCTPDEARQVLGTIGVVHADQWEGEHLAKTRWLRRGDVTARAIHSTFLQHSGGFAARYGEVGDGRLPALLDWLRSNGVELLRALQRCAPETLQHCDLRLDNVFFSDEGVGHERIVLFDWQLVGRGPGVFDAAYLLSGGLPAEHPPAVADALVRDYYETLVANGVQGYSWDDCLRGYRLSLLAVLHRIASSESIELGDDRGSDLMRVWLERVVARLAGVDLAQLL